METIKAVFGNYILVSAVLAWLCAQVIKTLLTLFATRKFDPERLVGAGGMPSAHSAMVCALTIAMSRVEGVSSPLFAMAFLFAAVVMYDAMGVRRAAGEQAKVLNRMLDQLDWPIFGKKQKEQVREEERSRLSNLRRDDEDEDDKELKEGLGHTPLQVLAGALLGILVAMIVPQ
nr:divergent PAP2 family protein [uncultured Solibaculum sp.]